MWWKLLICHEGRLWNLKNVECGGIWLVFYEEDTIIIGLTVAGQIFPQAGHVPKP